MGEERRAIVCVPLSILVGLESEGVAEVGEGR